MAGDKRATVTKPSGHTFTTDFDGGMNEKDTIQCCHCGKHWEYLPGSGRKRGFCMKCMGVTCGKQACELHCVPYEKQWSEPLKCKPHEIAGGILLPRSGE